MASSVYFRERTREKSNQNRLCKCMIHQARFNSRKGRKTSFVMGTRADANMNYVREISRHRKKDWVDLEKCTWARFDCWPRTRSPRRSLGMARLRRSEISRVRRRFTTSGNNKTRLTVKEETIRVLSLQFLLKSSTFKHKEIKFTSKLSVNNSSTLILRFIKLGKIENCDYLSASTQRWKT